MPGVCPQMVLFAPYCVLLLKVVSRQYLNDSGVSLGCSERTAYSVYYTATVCAQQVPPALFLCACVDCRPPTGGT